MYPSSIFHCLQVTQKLLSYFTIIIINISSPGSKPTKMASLPITTMIYLHAKCSISLIFIQNIKFFGKNKGLLAIVNSSDAVSGTGISYRTCTQYSDIFTIVLN